MLVENTPQIVLAISMVCLVLSIITLIISLIKYGLQEGFSLKTRLVQVSFGLLGCYGIFTIILIILID